jgi:hypothetical protein
MNRNLIGWTIMAAFIPCAPAVQAQSNACNDACLRQNMDRNLAQMTAHKTNGLDIAPNAEIRENTVRIALGEGNAVVEKETRHIYTDGRNFPPEDELWGTLLGRSIGHWEGQTLVIETISVKEGLWADTTPTMFSEKARYTERIRQIGPNTLENRVTVTDPGALTKPWTFVKHYQRLTDPKAWVSEPETCGGPEDRNPIVNGRVTVTLPK